MLALALVVAATPLVEVHSGPAFGTDARVAIAGDLVVTAAGQSLHVLRPWTAGTAFETHALPCDAVDLRAADRFGRAQWAVLCADRVVWQREDALSEVPLDHAAPTAFAVDFFFEKIAVGYADGTVSLYTLAAPPKTTHYDGKILAVSIHDIDVVDAVTDAPCPACRASSSSLTVVAGHTATGTLGPGASKTATRAWLGGRIIDDVEHGGVLIDTTVPIVDLDVTDAHVCFTTLHELTCLEPAPDDGTATSPLAAGQPKGKAPPVTLASPAIFASSAAVVVGAGGLVASPFVLGALAPGVGSAAVPVAALVAIGGAGSALGVAGLVAGIALVVAGANPPHMADNGTFLGSICAGFGNMASDCVAGVALAVGIVLAVACVGIVGAGVLAILAAPSVERAVSGGVPAVDPFWPALGGAAAGGTLGLALSLLLEIPADAADESLGDDQHDLDQWALNTGAVVLTLGGGAVGGAVGYGLAHR